MRYARAVLAAAVLLLAWAGPAAAQTFVFGGQGEPVQLDPAVITDGISSRITRQVFDGLVRYKGATTEVEPALAEKWSVSISTMASGRSLSSSALTALNSVRISPVSPCAAANFGKYGVCGTPSPPTTVAI